MVIGNFACEEEEESQTITKEIPKGSLLSLEEIVSGWDYYPEQLDLSWWGISEDSEE